MAIFSKTDPALKRQRDLETRLKDRRASRNNLIERRKAAEIAAAAHREKARKLAGDDADDAALSAAEAAMRREQDRAATVGDALGDIETAIVNIEAEIAEIVDARRRAETAAAVVALADSWGTLGATFDAAVGQLADLARHSATLTVDAHGLHVFLEAIQQQVPPAAALVATVLRDHAAAVLAGTAPASLPLPEALPVPLTAGASASSLQTLFCLRTIKWTDTSGKKHIVQQYEDAELEPHIAARAIKRQACVGLGDPRRSKLLHAHGGKHARDALDTIDLDSEVARDPAHDPIMSDQVLRAANFRVIDRGPAQTMPIAAQRLL
jgi:hypothetical protein